MRWITQGLAATTFGLALFCLTFVSARSPHAAADQQTPTKEFSQFAQPNGTSDQPGDQSSLASVWHFVSTAIEQTAAVAAPASATPPPPDEDLPTVVRNAKNSYKPVAKSDVLARQVALEAAVRRLDKYLKNSGANGGNWSAYLHLPALQEELKKGLQASPAALQEVAAMFVDGSTGLELAPFNGVAKALRPYVDLLGAYQNADAQAQFNRDLDTLADGLAAAAKQPANVDREKLGELYRHVVAGGQAPALAQQLRKQLLQPNLHIRAASAIVAGGMNDEIYEKTPVNDMILGTNVVGSGNTLGESRASLIPSRDRAMLEIKMTGTNTAKTVGYHGMVTIFSHSTTSLVGRKRILFDDAAFAGMPASADCCNQSTIDCVSVCAGPMITRIATRRVYGSHGEAQAIASEHANARLEGRMDSKAANSLGNLNRNYNGKFRYPLMRRGAYPQQLSYSTTRDWLSIDALEARPGELAANTPPPKQGADAQLSIRFHESLVDNGGGAMAPGKTVRSLAFRRSERNMLQERYLPAEFTDFVLCMAEAGAPSQKRDSDLAIPFDQFQALMKDRFNLDVTKADYDKLARAMYEGNLTQDQFNRYLADLSKDAVSYDDVKKTLADAKRGDLQVNYSGMTFADENPITVQFHDNQFQLTLRIKSTTQPRLDSDGKRVVNAFPAEIYVTYRLSLKDGHAIANRVDNQYGIKQLPLPEATEANLSLRDKTRRSTLMTKTLPRRFFGGGEAGDREDEDATAEPIFPPQRESTGLTLRGPWQRFGKLPWTQLVAENGWVALGWSLPPAEGAE